MTAAAWETEAGNAIAVAAWETEAENAIAAAVPETEAEITITAAAPETEVEREAAALMTADVREIQTVPAAETTMKTETTVPVRNHPCRDQICQDPTRYTLNRVPAAARSRR